jgi:protein gp37
MGQRTSIAWTDKTFNPLWGCTKVSPACDHCYAEQWARRFGVQWGPRGEFRQFGDHHWNEPLCWNRAAQKAGKRAKVFCASMADVFDNRWPEGVRDRLWALIRATPMLDWQLLTKRPQNIAKMLPPDWGSGWPNVWLGCTAENQDEADRRLPHLLLIRAVIRFISYEPALGALDLESVIHAALMRGEVVPGGTVQPVSWVIIGGESGPGARPMDPNHALYLIEQCERAGIAVFMKQTGSNRPAEWWDTAITGKGDNPAEWWPWMRVQQFPLQPTADCGCER